MFHEFALDPEVLRTWPAFRYLIDQFGMSQGRLISRFPARWKKAVYAACEGIPPLDRSRIEVGLSRIDSKLYASAREFDSTLEWIRNAARSHIDQPFRAIITTKEQSNHAGCVDYESISDTTECWRPGIPPVRRHADDMAAAAEKLLKSSSEIVFVDQHYSCAARHVRPLAAFLKHALAGVPPSRLEYHLGSSGMASWFGGQLQRQVRYLGLPEGVVLTFYRWKERPGGEKFHARYILTDLGGIRYDVGLDESDDPDGPQTTDVSALDPETYRHRWNEYRPDSAVFDLADAWEVTTRSVVQTGPLT
jgi:hypothetical protein